MKSLFRFLLAVFILSSGVLFSTSAQEPDTVETQLEGLEFDAFLEESFMVLLRRDPELVLQLALNETIGLEEISLNNVSDAYIQETYAIYGVILEHLRGYDRTTLTEDQQLSYDIYEWYLDDVLSGQEFQYYN